MYWFTVYHFKRKKKAGYLSSRPFWEITMLSTDMQSIFQNEILKDARYGVEIISLIHKM